MARGLARHFTILAVCITISFLILLYLANQMYHDTGQNRSNYLQYEYNRYNVQLADGNVSALSIMTDLINERRMLMAQEMKDYRFLKGESLERLAIASNGNPKRSLILATWRSGSTFLGDVLNAVPGNYYHYEPFMDYEIVQIRGAPEADHAVGRLKRLLKCDYSEAQFLEYARDHVWLLTHNTRLWEQCNNNEFRSACFNPSFVSTLCKLFPFHSVKTVRLRLQLAEELLDDSTLNVKILLLIRDPRGTMQSRRHRDWCPGNPDCDQANMLCADLVSDYSAAIRLIQRFPDKLRVIRYEDMSLDVINSIKNLFEFFELDFTPSVQEFLNSHTHFDMGGVSSTFRDSKTAPFHWRNELTLDEVLEIERQCHQAMRLWGYRPAPREEVHLKEFDPLGEFQLSL